MFFILVLALVFSTTKGEQRAPTIPGICPDYTPVSTNGFHPAGLWYGLYFLNNGFKDDAKCFTAVATPTLDGTVKLVNTVIKRGRQISEILHAVPNDRKLTKYSLKKDGVDASGSDNIRTTTTLVLADNALVVEVVCATDGVNHRYKANVFSRLPTIDAVSLKKAKAALRAANIHDELTATEDCFKG